MTTSMHDFCVFVREVCAGSSGNNTYKIFKKVLTKWSRFSLAGMMVLYHALRQNEVSR